MIAFISLSSASHAFRLTMHSPVHAMFNREKLVKFNLHNATSTPIQVKAGDTEMTLAPGQNVPFKLPVGAKVVVQVATADFPQGAVLATATSELSDTTIQLNVLKN